LNHIHPRKGISVPDLARNGADASYHALVFLFSPDLRVSDAEREAATDFLKRHYAAGRLTEQELSARVDAAYRARTESQLDRLTADLPPLPVPVAPPRRLPRLAPLATGAVVLAGIVVIADVLPPELVTMLVALGLPMVMMLLFTLAPLALPVLGFLWLARMLSGPSHVQRTLPPYRSYRSVLMPPRAPAARGRAARGR
jgi:hypothetical protein